MASPWWRGLLPDGLPYGHLWTGGGEHVTLPAGRLPTSAPSSAACHWVPHLQLPSAVLCIRPCVCFSTLLSSHPTVSSDCVWSLFFTSVSPFANNFWLSSLQRYTVPLVRRGFGSLSFRRQWKWQWCLRSIKDVSHGFSPKRHSSLPSLRAAPWAQDERAGWSVLDGGGNAKPACQ